MEVTWGGRRKQTQPAYATTLLCQKGLCDNTTMPNWSCWSDRSFIIHGRCEVWKPRAEDRQCEWVCCKAGPWLALAQWYLSFSVFLCCGQKKFLADCCLLLHYDESWWGDIFLLSNSVAPCAQATNKSSSLPGEISMEAFPVYGNQYEHCTKRFALGCHRPGMRDSSVKTRDWVSLRVVHWWYTHWEFWFPHARILARLEYLLDLYISICKLILVYIATLYSLSILWRWNWITTLSPIWWVVFN